MRLLLILLLFSLIYIVTGKNNVKTLTESMGQEVIEIGTPIKELPMGLEEEPAADSEEDMTTKFTSSSIMPATKKDVKKTTSKDINLSESRKKMKDVEKIDGMTQEDEEARIEKELAEIYKDTAEYKSDSAEEPGQEVKETPKPEPSTELPPSDDAASSEEMERPIAREKNNFKFQPDSTAKHDVQRFRTSIDEISCNNRQKLSGTPMPTMQSNRAYDSIHHGLTVISMLFCYAFMCS